MLTVELRDPVLLTEIKKAVSHLRLQIETEKSVRDDERDKTQHSVRRGKEKTQLTSSVVTYTCSGMQSP